MASGRINNLVEDDSSQLGVILSLTTVVGAAAVDSATRRYYIWVCVTKHSKLRDDQESPSSSLQCRGVDADPGSFVADRAIWTRTAAGQADGYHVRNGHERHG